MLVMLDNYDSFSHNLARYFAELGHPLQVIRNDAISLDELVALRPTALIISPGPCTPNESGISLAAIDYFAGRIPLLGVCLGHQAIAQVFGAKIVRAQQVMHGKTSQLSHRQQGLFKGLPMPLTVTRYHSLLIANDSLPACFVVDAECQNSAGELEIMAIRHRQLAIYGVQFHPESVLTEAGHQLLDNFLQQLAAPEDE
ncbi:anthranilate synthase component II [Idiomarina xiamenensis]|uniref:Para-aminobenzoate synthase component II n=1 Tax=Idiomarina xiamenensis 10-D-4 TaxID=740709 RepID=K2KCV0_9GAMM|nr:aminodeoxychorismate/anthranilate synthase component II [Idiomarina xiamenensis]EKE84517.1 para-aminobenzoate synthase component II [Idiomarina xiamenensis 10-D-4]